MKYSLTLISLLLSSTAYSQTLTCQHGSVTICSPAPVEPPPGGGGEIPPGGGGGPPPGGTSDLLPPDRNAEANWKNAGLVTIGGIPHRTTVCATLNPSGGNDRVAIQNAVDACPVDQVLMLGAGQFIVEGDPGFVLVNKGITVRGAGPGKTTVLKKPGATMNSYIPGAYQGPLFMLAPQRWNGEVGSTALTKDVKQGDTIVEVASAEGLAVGQVVLIDERSGAQWMPSRTDHNSQVWASPDYKVQWNKHNPTIEWVDDFPSGSFPIDPGSAGCWFSRCDRPTNELHQIKTIDGNKITFDDPIMTPYRVHQEAQLVRYVPMTQKAGVEEMTLSHGDESSVQFNWCAYCWAKNVETVYALQGGFKFNAAFRNQLEGVYSHDSAWPVNGGAGYNWDMTFGASEILIENSISTTNNKTIVGRSAGAGSVVAYNYMDMSYINGQETWVEIGANASHEVGVHHVLFEGNESNNFDSDYTHGNTIYVTVFRNWLTGFRHPFTTLSGKHVDDLTGCCGPLRAAGGWAYSYWFTFLGNVLGTQGKMNGWEYESIATDNNYPAHPTIWFLGVTGAKSIGDDPHVRETALRDGNWDWVTSSQRWDREELSHTFPDSLYLSAKPAWWPQGSKWPWVDPTTGNTDPLPVKMCYDQNKLPGCAQ